MLCRCHRREPQHVAESGRFGQQTFAFVETFFFRNASNGSQAGIVTKEEGEQHDTRAERGDHMVSSL